MIPDVDCDKILYALDQFDKNYRNTTDWAGWDKRLNHEYAIKHNDLLDPAEKVICLAEDIPANSFSGKQVSNRYLEKHGFIIAALHEAVSSIQRVMFQIPKTCTDSKASEPLSNSNPTTESFHAVLAVL